MLRSDNREKRYSGVRFCALCIVTAFKVINRFCIKKNKTIKTDEKGKKHPSYSRRRSMTGGCLFLRKCRRRNNFFCHGCRSRNKKSRRHCNDEDEALRSHSRSLDEQINEGEKVRTVYVKRDFFKIILKRIVRFRGLSFIFHNGAPFSRNRVILLQLK